MPDAQNEIRTVDLITAIDRLINKVHTQSLDLSFNELLDMFRNQELDISPDYQRLFQWSVGARSRFVESLLLEMPVPPIYVLEEDNGTYSLIDGLQRFGSYLHLRGELDAPHLDPPVVRGEKLVLQDCDIADELNGKTYDQLGVTLQIKLKRAFVRVEVVRKGSDHRFKYHMFKRLNTGGTLLSAQQLRNCTVRLLNPRFNDFIIRISKLDEFVDTTTPVTQQNRLQAFDQELVLRFFAMKNYRQSFTHDVTDFLTEYMELVSDPANAQVFNYETEERLFRKVFAVLKNSLSEQSFTYANKAGDKLTRGFSVYHFEAISVGLVNHVDRLDETNAEQMARLRDCLTAIKLNPEFVDITTGGGKNSPGPLSARIQFVSDRLAGFAP